MVIEMTNIYKLDGKLFRYDEKNGIVEYISKADDEMLQDEAEWKEKYGHGLYDIDKDGYIVLNAAGLCRENWKRKAVRDEYLHSWIDELDEESRCLAADFERYELPYLKEAL